IAALLETNQPLIESAYGPDKLLDFINMLQVDIDQVVGKVIDAFAKKRQLEKRLKAVQRLLREDRHSDKGEVERLDALELDKLLSEICLMNTHTEMYWRFVRRRLKGASLEADQEEELLGNYLLLEQYYMQESVRKAIDMDAKEEGLLRQAILQLTSRLKRFQTAQNAYNVIQHGKTADPDVQRDNCSAPLLK
ncbi:hypothetical protein OSTOST_18575, partial [Ostertagia ostertagi]